MLMNVIGILVGLVILGCAVVALLLNVWALAVPSTAWQVSRLV